MKRTIHHAATSRILGGSLVLRGTSRAASAAVAKQTTRLFSPSARVPDDSSTVPFPVKLTQHSSAAPHILHPDTAADTALVDGLLAHTRQVMGDVGSIPHHIIAYSGGVDSSLVAALLFQSQSSHTVNTTETVRAILGISPAVPMEQIELARRVAAHIGMPLTEIPTAEGGDETYIANTGQACLACKTHLYSTLQAVVKHSLVEPTPSSAESSTTDPASIRRKQQQQQQQQLYNGTNADDLQDPTRLGLIAANNYQVQSVIRHLSKDQVRQAARHLGLPNWNHAASPCLRSRLALGVPAVSQHLKRIEQAERFVRWQLTTVMDETSNLRVRLLAGNRACIEIDADKVNVAAALVETWQSHFDELGFDSVTLRSFKSGSVATASA